MADKADVGIRKSVFDRSKIGVNDDGAKTSNDPRPGAEDLMRNVEKECSAE